MTSSSAQSVLVLNKSFLPVHVTTLKRAICMVYMDVAKFVDDQYRMFDFESWQSLAVDSHHDAIGMVGASIRLPRVVCLQTFDRLPKKQVRFSRINIFLRDQHECQYCGERPQKNELSLDHVVPRAQNGATTWENIVCCCVTCNRRKGGRTPREAGMELRSKPRRPSWYQCIQFPKSRALLKDWMPYLSMIDASYWNVELEP